MKLAISATGKDLDSKLDPSFGRANYFVIVDVDSGDIVEVINNSAAQDAAGGAGINAATIVAGSGAQTVLTGQVGPNAFGVLQAGGIKVISNISGTVREAVEQYKKGTFSSPDEGPDVAVHPGQAPGGRGRGMGGGGRGRGIAGGGRGMGGGGGRGLGGGSGMGRGLGKKSKR